MIAVIFEVEVAPGQRDAYLDMAATMRRHLAEAEGFISIERFESLTTPGRLLSLSFWEDEAALTRWRSLPAHRGAQAQGRAAFFADYRLRVAGILRDYGMFDRAAAPADSKAAHGI